MGRPSAEVPLRHPLAVAIALVSGFLLWVTLQRAYWDYWFFPEEKAADGYYTYPQLRYWFFDSVLLLWCVDGLIACSLSLRSVANSLFCLLHRADSGRELYAVCQKSRILSDSHHMDGFGVRRLV